MYCKVFDCRYSNTHTTIAHKCGSCGLTGHGQTECGHSDKIKKLEKYYGDRIPKNYNCLFSGCDKYFTHTSEAHCCSNCNERLHGPNTCPKKQIKNYKLKCPLCKTNNIVSSKQTKILGLSESCCVCMDSNVNIFLPSCGHVCLCHNCMDKISEKDLINNEIEKEDILEEKYGTNIELVKSTLKDYPSFMVLPMGMGCSLYIRRLNNNEQLEALFMHSDDWGQYSIDKTPELNKFIQDYCQVII
jgi:hypothetical protein